MSRHRLMLTVNADDCPCNGCVPPKRNATCHGSCTEYLTWNDEHLKKLEEVHQQRNITDVYYEGARRRNKDMLQKGSRVGRNSHGPR